MAVLAAAPATIGMAQGPGQMGMDDRRLFTAWFTWLAEAVWAGVVRRSGVADCSSLLRFAYREALRPHTAEWARQVGAEWLPPLGELRKPVTAAELFETPRGRRQFADAENLMKRNTRFVSREVGRARGGDLLFYKQLVEEQPWHAMVVLEKSAFDGTRGPMAVYHTGAKPGEMRRPKMEELLRHPEARWRPLAGNSNFQGVYRWNILCEEE